MPRRHQGAADKGIPDLVEPSSNADRGPGPLLASADRPHAVQPSLVARARVWLGLTAGLDACYQSGSRDTVWDAGTAPLGIAQESEQASAQAIAQGSAQGSVSAAPQADPSTASVAAAVAGEELFIHLATQIGAACLLFDSRLRDLLYASEAYEQVTGRSAESILTDPQSWMSLVHPDDRQSAELSRTQALLRGDFDITFRILRDDAAVRWIRARGVPLADESGCSERVAVIAEDVSEACERQQRLTRLDRTQAVTRAIGSAVLRLQGRDALLQEACRVAVEVGAYASASVYVIHPLTLSPSVLCGCAQPVRHADGSAGRAALDEVTREPSAAVWVARERRALIINSIQREPFWEAIARPLLRLGIRSSAAFPLISEGRIVAVLQLLSARDATFSGEEQALIGRIAENLSFALENIDKSQRLRHIEHHDALTGMANGALFADRVNQLIVSADPEHHCIAVVLLDIERFSELNDILGHAACDDLLRVVGHRLSSSLPERCTVARITADTFAVAGASIGDDAASALLERLLDVLSEPITLEGRRMPISVQLGVALFPADGADADSLFRNADSALREARLTGQRYAYYSTELTERIAQKRLLEERLRIATAQQQFVLHYQPRVDLDSGRMVGAEALIRWQHPEDGLISPLHFIPLAEETGLIVEIGAWAIDTVCRQQAAWLEEGLSVIPIAVNLSSIQFARSDLLETVRSTLRVHALTPQLLELELTESAVMINPEAARSTLRALRDLGCALALDDFGTGYSSLAHLKRFPFDAVKIDRGFVTDITQNREDAAIASAIIAMAHQMGLLVIAEGVETVAQLEHLRVNGCDQIQGHLFSPAVPAAAFADYLRQQRTLPLTSTPPLDARGRLIIDGTPGMRETLDRDLGRDGYQRVANDRVCAGREG